MAFSRRFGLQRALGAARGCAEVRWLARLRRVAFEVDDLSIFFVCDLPVGRAGRWRPPRHQLTSPRPAPRAPLIAAAQDQPLLQFFVRVSSGLGLIL